MRVYEFAKKHKLTSKDLLKVCGVLGIKSKKIMSSLSEPEQKKLTLYFREKEKAQVKEKERIRARPKVKKPAEPAVAEKKAAVAEKEKAAPEVKVEPRPEVKAAPVPPVKPEVSAENLKPRAPVVTIMGHVDHGKTTILDAIRKSRIAQKEYGQITQKIGAYKIKLPQGSIVFLDTPGHEAFTAMRVRGAQVTDIVVLVVAADEGVKPQTVEAIDHAKSAQVPIIVALNKIDKPNLDLDKVKKQLSEYGLVPEEWGGQTVCVGVSGLTGAGLKELLEMILLVAEMAELKADPGQPASGTVIESHLDRAKGPVLTVLTQSGTLEVGDIFVAGNTWGRVRALIDDWGNRIPAAGPSTPAEVLGANEVIPPGAKFRVVPSEKEARGLTEKQEPEPAKAAPVRKLTLEDLYQEIKQGSVKELKMVLKVDYHGSLEAIRNVLDKIPRNEVNLSVIHSGTGPITESDILLASASNGIVIGFNVPLDNRSQELARREGVEVKLYRIIYELADEIRRAMEGLLEPEEQEVLNGQAVVKKVFSLSRNVVAAGCLVVDGKLVRDSRARVIRDGRTLIEGTLSSLKRFKDTVREVPANTECGVEVSNFKEFKEGDIIQSFVKLKIPRKLGGKTADAR